MAKLILDNNLERELEFPKSRRVDAPKWCICGNCKEMPTAQERVCCKRKNCLSLWESVRRVCLDKDVLHTAGNRRAHFCFRVGGDDSNDA